MITSIRFEYDLIPVGRMPAKSTAISLGAIASGFWIEAHGKYHYEIGLTTDEMNELRPILAKIIARAEATIDKQQ